MRTALNTVQKSHIRIETDLEKFLNEGGEITHPTTQDNAYNRGAKASVVIQKFGTAKLTSAEVRHIRSKITADMQMQTRISTMVSLAKKFGVSYYTIRKAANFETYKVVK